MVKTKKKVKGKREVENMKADLTISDRFTVLSILPAEGNFATLKVVRKLREQLSLTEAEIKEYGVVQIQDAHVAAIQNVKTDTEALAVAVKMFGAKDAQRLSLGIRNGTLGSGQITWTNGEKTTEMEFGDFGTEMIKNALVKLDKENKLEDKHFAIYEIFVEGKQ